LNKAEPSIRWGLLQAYFHPPDAASSWSPIAKELTPRGSQ